MTKANSSDPNKLDDGFGNVWSKCELGSDCGLQIVRPGKTQCFCDHKVEWVGDFSPIDETRGFKGKGWYFWDEVDLDCYGPYESHAESKAELLKYFKTLE